MPLLSGVGLEQAPDGWHDSRPSARIHHKQRSRHGSDDRDVRPSALIPGSCRRGSGIAVRTEMNMIFDRKIALGAFDWTDVHGWFSPDSVLHHHLAYPTI